MNFQQSRISKLPKIAPLVIALIVFCSLFYTLYSPSIELAHQENVVGVEQNGVLHQSTSSNWNHVISDNLSKNNSQATMFQEPPPPPKIKKSGNQEPPPPPPHSPPPSPPPPSPPPPPPSPPPPSPPPPSPPSPPPPSPPPPPPSPPPPIVLPPLLPPPLTPVEPVNSPNQESLAELVLSVTDNRSCDMFSGEWVPNPEAPYYTNNTCMHIQDHQNCMKYGKPDKGYMNWKWKPDNECDLPLFNAHKFLELLRGKSLAFVGDSVARNHMQSLLCLLSRDVLPIDISKTKDYNFRQFQFPDYNFTISIFWSPYLVRYDPTQPFKLYLDELDEYWPTQVESFDFIIISAGHWFNRPSMFYLNKTLVGGLYCQDDNIPHLPINFSLQGAFRTAFNAINNLKNFKGVTFLRTFATSHYVGGAFDSGGDCVRTKPLMRNEIPMEDLHIEMYKGQLHELKVAQKVGGERGLKFRLFDDTRPMFLRPDGHPSKYGHWPNQKVSLSNDCVHWCLPGPIDTMNDLLQELITREFN